MRKGFVFLFVLSLSISTIASAQEKVDCGSPEFDLDTIQVSSVNNETQTITFSMFALESFYQSLQKRDVLTYLYGDIYYHYPNSSKRDKERVEHDNLPIGHISYTYADNTLYIHYKYPHKTVYRASIEKDENINADVYISHIRISETNCSVTYGKDFYSHFFDYPDAIKEKAKLHVVIPYVTLTKHHSAPEEMDKPATTTTYKPKDEIRFYYDTYVSPTLNGEKTKWNYRFFDVDALEQDTKEVEFYIKVTRRGHEIKDGKYLDLPDNIEEDYTVSIEPHFKSNRYKTNYYQTIKMDPSKVSAIPLGDERNNENIYLVSMPLPSFKDTFDEIYFTITVQSESVTDSHAFTIYPKKKFLRKPQPIYKGDIDVISLIQVKDAPYVLVKTDQELAEGKAVKAGESFIIKIPLETELAIDGGLATFVGKNCTTRFNTQDVQQDEDGGVVINVTAPSFASSDTYCLSRKTYVDVEASDGSSTSFFVEKFIPDYSDICIDFYGKDS